MSLRYPLVIILGSTGSGKTKLSLDLAKKFGGEILGSDSMQIYKYIDIISAKPTIDERKQAPHHLVDILEPRETCTVLEYRNKALPIIDNLLSEKKLPVIVGGTNYYIESILWKMLVEEPNSPRKLVPWIADSPLSSKELHDKLKIVDPEMAKRLHPNNKRKILRALQVCEDGKQLSDILNEQHTQTGGDLQGGPLRYPNTIIFWLKWEQEVLDNRINKRVDEMMNEGLLDELKKIYNIFHDTRAINEEIDYTRGIFQMIGFKEFHSYLMLDDDQRESDEGKRFFTKGIDDLKLVTRRYAKKQTRWITNRFLGRLDRNVPPVYALTTEDLSKWDEEIKRPAIEIIESYMHGETCDYQPMEKIKIESAPNSQDDTFFCEDCQRVFIGKFQWNQHIKSNKHRKIQEKVKKQKLEDATN